MGTIAFIRSSKTLQDLSNVKGEVSDIRMIKHKNEGKFETTIEDVLVLSIEGSDEKFGFQQKSDAFKKLLGFNTAGKTFEIYFDPEGKRIEEGVTLHIFDLTVGQSKIIDIEKTNKEDRLLSIFFFALALFWIVMPLIGIKQNRKKTAKLATAGS
jgi:hypothetical protein